MELNLRLFTKTDYYKIHVENNPTKIRYYERQWDKYIKGYFNKNPFNRFSHDPFIVKLQKRKCKHAQYLINSSDEWVPTKYPLSEKQMEGMAEWKKNQKNLT